MREGGREHGSLPTAQRHGRMLDTVPNLGKKAHVQHPVRLIENEELDPLEGDPPPLHKVEEPARGGGEDVAASAESVKLLLHAGPSVSHAAGQAGSSTELSSLVVDLDDELSGGGHHDHLGSHRHPVLALRLGRNQIVDDREEEGRCLARAGLGARHEISAGHEDGDAVLLDRGGDLILGSLDVAGEERRKPSLVKRLDRLGLVLTGDLDIDFVILGEVDAG